MSTVNSLSEQDSELTDDIIFLHAIMFSHNGQGHGEYIWPTLKSDGSILYQRLSEIFCLGYQLTINLYRFRK